MPPSDPNLLVGFETADDAVVYRLTARNLVMFPAKHLDMGLLRDYTF